MNQPLGLQGRRVNVTLHGRSVFRRSDCPGHNVFKGYNHPGTGDGIDLFCPGGTVVRAVERCKLVKHSADGTKKEVIYLEGPSTTAVYAHINAASNEVGRTFKEGEAVGAVRGDLNDPHLHFELWFNGKAISAPTGPALLTRLQGLLACPMVYYRGKPVAKAHALIGVNGKLYVNFATLIESLGIESRKTNGDTFLLFDKDQRLFEGKFEVETSFVDEPGFRMVRATDVLKGAGMTYDWVQDVRRLFIH